MTFLRKTYPILNVNSELDEKKHSGKGEKYFSENFKEWYCVDCFKKFIEINQDLKYEEIISHESHAQKSSKTVAMSFYKTKKTNPIFTFEEGMIKIGECKLDVGQIYENLEERKIKREIMSCMSQNQAQKKKPI